MLIFIHMIRRILFAAILMSGMTVKAQVGAMDSRQPALTHPQQAGDTSNIPKKWFVTKYAGVSSGFMAFKGGSGSFLSVPLAWQVNRQLSNNVYAFGSLSVTPYIFHYNNVPYPSVVNKNSSFMQTSHFNAIPEAKIGLMYINNERTFSISGSIGVSRGSYNSYSPFYAPMYSPMPQK